MKPTDVQIKVGSDKARAMLKAYSGFYNNMVTDEEITDIVTQILTAVFAAGGSTP